MNKEYSLSEITKNITDGKHGDCINQDDSGFYFISVKDIGEFGINYSNARQITEKDYIDSHKRTKLEAGDTIIANTGNTIGKMLFISSSPNVSRTTFQKSVAIVKPNTELVLDRYLYYVILANVQRLRNAAVGSAQKNLLLDDMRRFKVKIHQDKIIQKKIVDVLFSVDKKIEINQRVNAELESMAKTLYDYWFVQFAYPHPSSPKWDMEALQNSQNPPVPFGGGAEGGGGLVWNEALKREIPLGWEVKNLEDIENNIVTGKTPSTSNPEYYGGDIPFITIGDIRGNMHVVDTQIKLSKAGAEIQKNKLIPKGSLCVTCIASPGLIGFATKDSQTNQQINSIVIQNEENRTYLYFALNDYFKFAKGAKTGNTFANMNKGDFSSIKLVYPDKSLLLSFEEIVSPMVKEILTRQLESQTLTELRDWLLPMLMNGQVKVGPHPRPLS